MSANKSFDVCIIIHLITATVCRHKNNILKYIYAIVSFIQPTNNMYENKSLFYNFLDSILICIYLVLLVHTFKNIKLIQFVFFCVFRIKFVS